MLEEPTETPTSAPVADTPAAALPASDTPAPAASTSEPTAAPATDATDPPAYWAEDWRERLAGNDENALKQLRRYASPEGIWKKARELEKRMSSGEFKRVKPEGGDAAALAAWRTENNVPESADGYVDALPEDLPIAEEDFPALTRIFSKMHEAGTPASEAAEVVKEYYAMRAETAEKQALDDRQTRVATEDALRTEWGHDYRPNMDALGMLVEEFGSREDFATIGSARLPDGTRLGDSPTILKFLVNIARDRYSDALLPVTPAGGLLGGGTLAEQIAALEAEIQDTKGTAPDGYWNNPAKQSRYLALLGEQERQAKRNR